MADMDANHRHIFGYPARCAHDVRKYFLVAAASCWVMESCSTKLLEDDRMFARMDELEEDIQSERVYLESLHDEVWNYVATLARCEDFDGRDLRDLSIQALHTGLAYLHQHGLADMYQLPLSLLRGDIEENVTSFASQPLPDNDRTHRG